MKLLYITEGINPVFFSQVVELLNSIEETKYFEGITLLIGLKNLPFDENIKGLNKHINVFYFKTYPIYPFFNYLTEVSLSNIFNLIGINSNYIIHTRTEFLGTLTYSSYLKKHKEDPNLLVDIRGSVYEEVKYYGKMNNILKFLKLFQFKNLMQYKLKNVKYFNAVTEELKKYIIDTYKIQNSNISVIPTISGKSFTFNENKRHKIRKELGLTDNDILFVFSSGSSQAWQNDDAIVNTLIDRGFKVLMLTKKEYLNKNIISKFVDYTVVSDYLNAADIGIIIRNNDIVNNVASPIKFSEYLCCGLPIIANNSMAIVTNIIRQTKYGQIVELTNINSSILEKLLSIDRKEISTFGESIFGINTITNKYLGIYNNMKEKK
ncbi:glycosyltransferase [Arcobacter sp. s6]|uniref:glycosyltransferase n=1 Tax=Arcobacter sp. s6 TaxID=3230363 RepID=UPI0034A00FC3